jgi:hypothetical protein
MNHGLAKVDINRRLQFCKIILNEYHHFPDIVTKIIWSDDANIKMSGHLSRHNCVYWNVTNPTLQLKLPWTSMEYLCEVLLHHLVLQFPTYLKEWNLVSPTSKCCESIWCLQLHVSNFKYMYFM